MKTKFMAIALVAVLALSFVALAGESDAEPEFGKLPELGSFDDMGGGSITVYLNNTDDESAVTVTVQIRESGTENVLGSSDVELQPGATDVACTISFGYQSSGEKVVDICLLSGDSVVATQAGIPIQVNHSMWKDSLTYIIIIVAIIIIVVIAYLYMRNAPKRKADKMDSRTFTEMEEARKQRKSAPSGPTKYEGSGSKKRK